MKVYGRENCVNDSEKLFFDWLQNLDESKLKYKLSFAVASVRPDNPYGPDIEIDFVLVGEAGILAIEVKGGILSIKDGEWYQYQKPIRDPFAQVSSNYYALMDFLIAKRAIRSAHGYFACAFPAMAIDKPMSNIYPNLLYLDKRFEQAPELFIDDIFDYSYKKYGKKTLTYVEIENIKKLLAPDYDFYVRDMARYTDDTVIKLSSEQSVLLDNLSLVKRMVINGPPGSGKTILATELLLQKEKKKVKAIYICYNKTLRNKVEYDIYAKLGHSPEYVSVQTIEDVKRLDPDLFDFVILDEAQDYLSNDEFDYIDKILKKGLEIGEFRIFISLDQDIFKHIDYLYFAQLIKNENIAFCMLKHNYRNTANIINYAKKITSIDPGEVYGNPVGLEVVTHSIPYDGLTPDFDEYTKQINNTINALLDEGFEPRDIAILTANQLQRSSLSDTRMPKIKIKHGIKLVRPQDVDWSKDLNAQGIIYGSPWILKGIDAKVVVCLDYYDPERQKESAFVAFTRARSRLIVFAGNKVDI